MKLLIVEVDSDKFIQATIREGEKNEMPSLKDGWLFNFSKHIRPKDKTAYVLVKEESPNVIEGCMIFSLHQTFGPFMDYLEVAPHNRGSSGKYKRVAGCLIAYACGLSFEKGTDEDKGILTFLAFGNNELSKQKVEKLYRNKYGAIMNPLGFMEIHQDQSHLLIDEYLSDKEE